MSEKEGGVKILKSTKKLQNACFRLRKHLEGMPFVIKKKESNDLALEVSRCIIPCFEHIMEASILAGQMMGGEPTLADRALIGHMQERVDALKETVKEIEEERDRLN